MVEPAMSCRLQFADVHKLAKSIGQEFQRIIEEYGGNCVSVLVPTVVDALEYLELYVEEHQKLRTQNYKLMLENDNLVAERELRMKLALENEELKRLLHKKESEARGLTHRVERLQQINEEINQQIEALQGILPANNGLNAEPATLPEEVNSKEETPEEDTTLHTELQTSLNPPPPVYRKRHYSCDDVLEGQKMQRRLSIAESQLERTLAHLHHSQQAMERVVEENSVLKAQVEEFQAESALHSMQECRVTEKKGTPKFYKKDLIVVLRERNELKEKLDALQDELAIATAELRRHKALSDNKSRSEARVRDILDSFTESLRPMESPRFHPPPPLSSKS